MERKHLDIVRQRFDLADQMLIVLDVADEYQFGDAELISILNTNLAEYLQK